jgi:hypothetical protein
MLGIKREAKLLDDGTYSVKVTPPEWSTFSASEIILTKDQFFRFHHWLHSPNIRIQDILADLSAEQREILKTGISPKQWKETFGDD